MNSQSLIDGFLNPSFLPSLCFRTVVCLTLASLAACVIINVMSSLNRDQKRSLINRAAQLMLPMLLMPFLGIWYLWVIPEDSRSWVLGGSPAMMLFFGISVGASLAIGAYALVGLCIQRLYINGATASLLLLLAFGATAGGEFVREGSRKPYTIRQVLYSNGIRPHEVAHLRKVGCVAEDPFPIAGGDSFPNEQLVLGAKVFRRQCAVCHTVVGSNAVTHLTATWDEDQMRMNIAKLQHTKPFMPPFAGTPEELEAVVQYVRWSGASCPSEWPIRGDAKTLVAIADWLDQAGTAPATPLERKPQ